MIPSLIILCITAILLIISTFIFSTIKIKHIHISTYWIVTILGAILMIAFGLISPNEIGSALTADASINPLKIVCIFFSMTFLSIFEDEMGLFQYIAKKSAKMAGNNQIVLFFIIYLLVSVLTIFTSNDIVILTFTPFICYFAKHSKINPIPYLIMEFAAANTWSMFLIIGNPTNIYLAGSAGVTFEDYLSKMTLPTIFAGITELGILFLLFRKQLMTKMNPDEDIDSKIDDKAGLIIGLVYLIACLILLIISNHINIQMWLICLSCCSLLILSYLIYSLIKRRNPKALLNVFKRLPYQLIPFIIGMFIIVLGLASNGVTSDITKILECNHPILSYGLSAFVSCNLINNIPMSVLYSSIISGSTPILYNQALYSTIIASNIGAFLTPLGAFAGIMFTDLVSKQDIKLSFVRFSKYGLIIAIPTLAAALFGLFIICH